MNENAPEEASNLNIPCPSIRSLVGSDLSNCSHLKEHYYRKGLSPAVLLKQDTASARMRDLHCCPTQSYKFFLSTNHPKP
mmetsp:Transcript_16316/g.29597  ORF Transcript_16316/g.29597 Transcript_16316/m.29597 type:complete len:80 (-) Transcript_16316:483-722(-)